MYVPTTLCPSDAVGMYPSHEVQIILMRDKEGNLVVVDFKCDKVECAMSLAEASWEVSQKKG